MWASENGHAGVVELLLANHSLTEYGYKGNKTLKRGGGDRAAG